jgi:hypothetical protein
MHSFSVLGPVRFFFVHNNFLLKHNKIVVQISRKLFFLCSETLVEVSVGQLTGIVCPVLNGTSRVSWSLLQRSPCRHLVPTEDASQY